MTSVGDVPGDRDSEVIDGFFARLPFEPDRFQREAIAHLAAGRSVVVAAPTGAGKTLIAEAAVSLALAHGTRVFYTTPIKALSNQKFRDLREEHGDSAVGLLTGDNVVNGDAPVVVMTTEVLRNMIYADSEALRDLGYVILDEVHYLQDRYRGSVWEEVIIHLPQGIPLVNLSATIANAEEFTGWIRARRGPTELVQETHRPVPLESMYMLVDTHRDGRIEMYPVFDRRGQRPNPGVVKQLGKGRGRYRRFLAPRRLAVAEELQQTGLLPAIYFIFSRAGCDQAAERVAEANLGLTTSAERSEIRRVAEEMTAHLADLDLAVLGYGRWLAALEQGVAAHHAGLVPAFKETVETLFSAGLVRLVFATETLALGINMPARTVVIERLSKFNGETHELLQPGDYTQLTGRAGRRGIDTEGTAVILHQRDIPFDKVAGIAAAGSHSLTSSFAPSYNMVVNLVANYERSRAEELLRASFAQHRIEERRTALESRIAERQIDVDQFVATAQCELGDVTSYDSSPRSDIRQQLREWAQGLLAGEVLGIPADDGFDQMAVVARGYGPNPRLHLVGADGSERRVAAGDLSPATTVLGAVALPEPFRPKERAYRRAVGAAIADAVASGVIDPVGHPVLVDAVHDPVAGCPHLEEHLGWLERARKTEKEIARLQRRLERRDDDLVSRFGALLSMLQNRGHVDGWTLTSTGERLRHVYNELDLLLTEVATSGVLDELSPAELAGVLSVFVYEARRNDTAGQLPTAAIAAAVDAIHLRGDELAVAEDAAGIEMTRAPDDGYVERMHAWAAGAMLDDLFDDEARAGDFVRIARQTLDLLRQVRDVFPQLRSSAARAIAAIDRGVVAAGGQA